LEIEDVLSRVIKGAYNMPRRISRDARNLVRSMLEKVLLLAGRLIVGTS
jgi:hypothetical protein